ncbi:hypothetical protein HYT00_01325 [Candidatus Giovannonibacteria bacterium]|nr:hypothetical protein [Candidatus Giovannonibacteria bacterium]
MNGNATKWTKIGIVISIITLILLAITLYYVANLSNNFNKLSEDSEKRLSEAQRQYRTAEARARLLAIWAYLRLGRTPTELKPELEKTRQDLQQIFADSETQAKEFWAGIDKQLENLQKQIDGDRQKFFDSLEKTIQDLEQNKQ